MRTGEQKPADGELVKFAADTFDARTFDAVEFGFGDGECNVTKCNDTAFTVTEFVVVECSPSVNVENVGSRSRIAAVAAKNERSFSVIAHEGRARCTGLKQSPICPDHPKAPSI